MDELTKFLVKELIDGKSVTAIYGGGFKPPTKGHFDLVKTALKDFKDIDKFIIYVGSGIRDGIEQEQSLQVWDIYKELLPSKVQIEPSATPIGDIMRYAKNHPDEKVYFVIGYREGREDDLDDIKNRTKGVEEKYPNLEVRVIKTPSGDMSGTNARKALKKGDKEQFFTYLPTEVPANEKEDIYNILEPTVFKEGSCGYDIDAKTGKQLATPGGLEEADPKTGTGKKPKGSSRRLYTDEDPSDTVKVKFSTKQDIIDTFSKASFKSKPHARKSQVINLIHQRVRAAYERAKDPEVKKRLKTALDYAEQKKEASKEKTQRLKKENVAPNHDGKSAPFGSGYKTVKERTASGNPPRYRAIEKRGDKYYYIQDNPFAPGIRQEFGPYKTKEQAKKKMGTFPPSQNYRDITENTIPSIDILEKIAELTNYMREKGYNIDPAPSIELVGDDMDNAGKFLGKTAYYDPINKSITLYTYGRHPKDIVRSYAHEMIHHIQNLEGRLGDVSTTNTLEDDHINNLEKEANLKGTMTFRNWTDSIIEGKQINYTNPNFNAEWEEAIRYPEFKEMGKDGWLKIANQGKSVSYSSIKDKLGNVDLDFEGLEEPKKQRFLDAFKKGTIEMPIAIKFSDSDYDLVAGNTRLSGLIKNGIDPKIWVVDISNIQEKKNKDPFGLNQYARELAQGLEERSIHEVGEGSAKTYDWELLQTNPGDYTYGFTTDSGVEYEVNLVVLNYEDDETGEFINGLEIGFSAGEKDEYKSDIEVINKGEVFRVMATIVEIIQFAIKLVPDFKPTNAIIYNPARKKGEGATGNQRDKLYQAYIKKAIPNITFLKDGTAIIGKFDSLKESSYLYDTGVEKMDKEMEEKKYVIFCDMDGVLVDFDKGYKDLTGLSTKQADAQGKSEFWKLFGKSLKEKNISDKSYWASLDWMPDGKQLWSYISPYNPYVLTAPSVNFDIPFEERYKIENNQSMQGKTEWVQRLPNLRKLYFRSAQRKADFAGPNKILIDDRKDTIDSWNANGGIGILHTSAANTIKQLQDLGL